MNIPELVAVPPAVMIAILPVLAPAGTAAVICLELTVNAAILPAKRT